METKETSESVKMQINIVKTIKLKKGIIKKHENGVCLLDLCDVLMHDCVSI